MEKNILELARELSNNIWFRAVMTIVVYTLLAKAADLFICRILRRLTRKTKIAFDDQFVVFLHGPICWTIILLGVLHALVILDLAPPWQSTLPALAKSVVLVVWVFALIRFFNRVAEEHAIAIVARGKIGADLFLLLKNLARVILVVVAILWFLSIWQIDLTPFFASAGIAGIAVALAAKDTIANFFGGLSIFMDRTFKVGDYIVLDTGERGEVVEIGIRSTRINTRDDILITIPNSIIANSKIINESAPIPRFRIRVPVGVAYGSDLEKVERVLLEIATASPHVTNEPAPRVRLRALADSSVSLELLCWVDDPSIKGLEIHNLLRNIHKTFLEQNIVIPFPQRDVHIIDKLAS